jgi:hypothetical protein
MPSLHQILSISIYRSQMILLPLVAKQSQRIAASDPADRNLTACSVAAVAVLGLHPR